MEKHRIIDIKRKLTKDQELDIKKVMDNIDYLDATTDMCENKSVLECTRQHLV